MSEEVQRMAERLTNREIRERNIQFVFGSREKMQAFRHRLRTEYGVSSRLSSKVAGSLLDFNIGLKKKFLNQSMIGLGPEDYNTEWLHPERTKEKKTSAEKFIEVMKSHKDAPQIILKSHDPAHAADAISKYQGHPLYLPQKQGEQKTIHLLDVLAELSAKDLEHAIEAIKQGDVHALEGLHYLKLEGEGGTPENVRALFEAAAQAGVSAYEAKSKAHEEQRERGHFNRYIQQLQKKAQRRGH